MDYLKVLTKICYLRPSRCFSEATQSHLELMRPQTSLLHRVYENSGVTRIRPTDS